MKSPKFHLPRFILTATILTVIQAPSFCQQFGYTHWSKGEYAAQLIKYYEGFNPTMPQVWFRHTRLGTVIGSSQFIDFRADDLAEWHTKIDWQEQPNGMIKFVFKHYRKDHEDEDNHEDTIMLLTDIYGSRWKLGVLPMSKADYLNRTIQLRLLITRISRGNPPGATPSTPRPPSAPPNPYPDRWVCSLKEKPSGWVYSDRISCVCCGGTDATKWLITKIDHLPRGHRLWVCANQALPPGWIIIDRITCACCDGSNAPKWLIEKIQS